MVARQGEWLSPGSWKCLPSPLHTDFTVQNGMIQDIKIVHCDQGRREGWSASSHTFCVCLEIDLKLLCEVEKLAKCLASLLQGQ